MRRFIGFLKDVGAAIALLMAVPAMALAADSLGTLGAAIMPALDRLLGGDHAAAVTVWSSLLTIVGMIVSRVVLKKIPTVARGLAGKVIWSFLAGMFGDGVVTSNHTDPEELRRILVKKYPLLQIDVKKNKA